MKKLYVITRSDLPPGLQIAQSCHALQTFNDQHPDAAKVWEGNLVVLTTKDAEALAQLATDLGRQHLLVCFHEPDLGGALTAIAVAGEAAPLLSALPLALRGAAPRLAVA